MKPSQVLKIQKYMPELIRLTNCDSLFIAILNSLDVLSNDDVAVLHATEIARGSIGQAHLFYELIITKNNAFDALIKALEKTRQTGCLHILRKAQFEETKNPHGNAQSFFSNNENEFGRFEEPSINLLSNHYAKVCETVTISDSRNSTVCTYDYITKVKDIKGMKGDIGTVNLVSVLKLTEVDERGITRSYLAIEMPNCDLETRVQHLKKLKDSNDSTYNAANTTKTLTAFIDDVANGLHSLHEHAKIVHGCIKPANVFIYGTTSGQEIAKLGGFEKSRKFTDSEIKQCTIMMNTTCWTAPEAMGAINFDAAKATDIFQLGITGNYTLSIGHHPFGWSEKYKENVYMNIQDENINPKFLEGFAYAANHWFKWLMEKKSKNRPKSTQVVRHPIFWGWKESLKFLLDVGRCLSNNDLSSFKQEINEDYESWTNGLLEPIEWTTSISKAHLKVLFKNRPYIGALLTELIKLFRDKYMHYPDLEVVDNVELFKINNGFSDEVFTNYFLDKYPSLVIYLFCTLGKKTLDRRLFGQLEDDYFNIFKDMPSWEILMRSLKISQNFQNRQGGAKDYYAQQLNQVPVSVKKKNRKQ